jgi:hypothetical protein
VEPVLAPAAAPSGHSPPRSTSRLSDRNAAGRGEPDGDAVAVAVVDGDAAGVRDGVPLLVTPPPRERVTDGVGVRVGVPDVLPDGATYPALDGGSTTPRMAPQPSAGAR